MRSLTTSDLANGVGDLNSRRESALAAFADLALSILWKPARFYRKCR